MKYHVTIGGRTREVRIEAGEVYLDGAHVDAELLGPPDAGARAVRLGPAHRRIVATSEGRERWSLLLGAEAVEAEVVDERTRTIREMSGAAGGAGKAASIRAPMPGLVLKIVVEPGQVVAPGQGIVIVEAMKMENELTADAPARVAAVRVEPGETVDKGQVLVEMEALDDD